MFDRVKSEEKAKVIQRAMEEQVKREVVTQLMVKHKNLVQLHYYFEASLKFFKSFK